MSIKSFKENGSVYYVATCDSCGTQLPETVTKAKSEALIRRNAWMTKFSDKGRRSDLCEDCALKARKK
jgi:hypothetical protein